MSEQTKQVFERHTKLGNYTLNLKMLMNVKLDIYEKHRLSIPVEYIEKVLLESEKYVKESESSE